MMNTMNMLVQPLHLLEIKTVLCSNLTRVSYIETPALPEVLNRTISNIVNKRDNFFSLCCIAAALFSFFGRARSPRPHKKYIQRLHFNSKLMSMPLTTNPCFERKNDCSINVYQLEESKLVSVYHTKNR